MHDCQRERDEPNRDNIDANDAMFRIESADEELLSSKPAKHGRSTLAATTDVWMGPDGSRPDDSATSVRRYRGTPYGLNVGFGPESRFASVVSSCLSCIFSSLKKCLPQPAQILGRADKEEDAGASALAACRPEPPEAFPRPGRPECCSRAVGASTQFFEGKSGS
jgi:hypothetical protein